MAEIVLTNNDSIPFKNNNDLQVNFLAINLMNF